MRLIDADELKQAIEQGEGFSWDSHGKDDLCVRKKYIDNAPTVEEVSVIEFKDPLPMVKVQKIVKALSKRSQGEWIRLDLAKRVIAKFVGYLDDDMIARIQIALEKENEAEMKGDTE